jgi:esterase/lipase
VDDQVTSSMPNTILLIHGLWMTPRSWEHWKERYESRGYTVLAPTWPGMEVEVEALNADPARSVDETRVDDGRRPREGDHRLTKRR